jgi:hypothetical protein
MSKFRFDIAQTFFYSSRAQMCPAVYDLYIWQILVKEDKETEMLVWQWSEESLHFTRHYCCQETVTGPTGWVQMTVQTLKYIALWLLTFPVLTSWLFESNNCELLRPVHLNLLSLETHIVLHVQIRVYRRIILELILKCRMRGVFIEFDLFRLWSKARILWSQWSHSW